MAKLKLVHVMISITTLKEDLRLKMEPRTATAKNRLNTNGRLAILTFHSTEDRLVKKLIDLETFGKVNKKVIIPTRDEIGSNPRSRSCKLRVYKKKI
jgi:16S rRNA (cytosine1402-N4)-methyltransferase